MKLAVSNIAWSPQEADAAFGLMQRVGVHGLEIAPGLAFPNEPDAVAPSESAVTLFRAKTAQHGLELVSMQSLLFGVKDAQLFGSAEQRQNLAKGVERAMILAHRLDIPNLVFGSPGNRAFPDSLSPEQAIEQASETFHRLGERALELGCVLAIEPNSANYGTNFLTTVEAAWAFVENLSHPAIRLNFDIGTLLTNGEANPFAARPQAARAATSHVHISEPQLAPAPADGEQLGDIVRPVVSAGYAGWYSIEMRRSERDPLDTLSACIARAKSALEEATRGGHAK